MLRAVEDLSVTVDAAADKFKTALGNDFPCLYMTVLVNACVFLARLSGSIVSPMEYMIGEKECYIDLAIMCIQCSQFAMSQCYGFFEIPRILAC